MALYSRLLGRCSALSHAWKHVGMAPISPAFTRAASTASSDDPVLVEKVDGVAVITLNKPKALNALDVFMGDMFVDTINQLSLECDDIGAVVLTGAGRAFSAGGDLKFLNDRANDTPSRNSALMRGFYERYLCVRKLPVPVVAAINGPAIGAGLCLALACDMRIAATTAKMGVTFVGLGLHPGMGASHFLPQIVGPQQAARLMLTGCVVEGKEAADMGLVLKTLEPDEVLPEAIELASSMAAQGPIAVRSCVRSIRMKQDEGLDKALWREADAQSYCYASQDLKNGVDAVKNKKKPQFSQYEAYTQAVQQK